MRLKDSDLRELLEFVGECYGLLNPDLLQRLIISKLPNLIRSDFTSYNEVDPRRNRIIHLSDRRVSDEESQAFIRGIGEHPLIRHYDETNDTQALKISDLMPDRQFRHLALYDEFYKPLDLDRQLAISLPTRRPLVVGIALNRKGGDFSERDRLILNLLQPHLAQAYGNAEAVSRLQENFSSVLGALDLVNRGVIVITGETRIGMMTPLARRWLSEYFECAESDQLPDALALWISRQESSLGFSADAPLERRPMVVRRDGRRLIARLLSAEGRSMLILEEHSESINVEALRRVGLTRREIEVIAWVAQGKTNIEVAMVLGVSPRTVQKHLERIYQKMGVETRTAAALRALDGASC